MVPPGTLADRPGDPGWDWPKMGTEMGKQRHQELSSEQLGVRDQPTRVRARPGNLGGCEGQVCLLPKHFYHPTATV